MQYSYMDMDSVPVLYDVKEGIVVGQDGRIMRMGDGGVGTGEYGRVQVDGLISQAKLVAGK